MQTTTKIVGKVKTKKGGFVYHCNKETEGYGIITSTFFSNEDIPIGQTVNILTINFKSYYINQANF